MLEKILANAIKDFIFSDSRDYFKRVVEIIKHNKLYPAINVISGPSSNPRININGKEFLTFASNNYLGLANSDVHKELTIKGVAKYGVGSGSTRLLSGTLDIQVEFENKLAKFLNFDDTITFSSGFLANIGVIRMLIDPFPYTPLLSHNKVGIIISDELNHASVIDGVRLSKAERAPYKHNNMDALESLLKENRHKRKLILTDSVFSMEGDFAKLKEIAQLAKDYDAILMVDDSHGVGVLGPNGEGLAHHLGVSNDIDVVMGSFTKAFGSIGGYIATSKDIADYLRITARSYIFSDPIPPAIVAGLIKVTDTIFSGHDLRARVLANANRLRSGLKNLGFTVLGEVVPIVPILISDEDKVITFSEELLNLGILAPAVRRPAVPEGQERLRLSLMATHEFGDIDRLMEGCEQIGKKLGVI